MRHESKRAQSIVETHGNDAGSGKRLAAIIGFVGVAVDIRAAVNPHHHRPERFARFGRSPHIQIEAVFRDPGQFRNDKAIDAEARCNSAIPVRISLILRTSRSEVRTVLNPLPGDVWPRRAPAQRACRRRGVGYSAIGMHAGRQPGSAQRLAPRNNERVFERGLPGPDRTTGDQNQRSEKRHERRQRNLSLPPRIGLPNPGQRQHSLESRHSRSAGGLSQCHRGVSRARSGARACLPSAPALCLRWPAALRLPASHTQ